MTETLPSTNHGTDPTIPDGFSDADLVAQKARLDKTWGAFGEVRSVPELVSLFDRSTVVLGGRDPEELLSGYGYPSRSSIGNLDMGEWPQALDPRFVKDGFIYLFRGD